MGAIPIAEKGVMVSVRKWFAI